VVITIIIPDTITIITPITLTVIIITTIVTKTHLPFDLYKLEVILIFVIKIILKKSIYIHFKVTY